MNNMARIFLLFVVFLFSSCMTVYTEKQTEELSQVVYATKDSLDVARIDLADDYSAQATRIVKPPKTRITVQAVYKQTSAIKVSEDKQRVVMIPERYKNDTVIVVKSEEYQDLLKDKATYEQIKKDHSVLVEAKQKVDEELTKQAEYKDQMIKDLNQMQKTIVQNKLSLLKHKCIIAALGFVIAAGIYLRFKGIL